MEEDAVFAEIEALERQGEERRRKRRRQRHWKENVERDAPKREAFQVPDEEMAAAKELVAQRPAEAANLLLDLQVLRRLLNGTFYTTLDESWGVKTVPCRPRHFSNLRRERMPDFTDPYLLVAYTATRDSAFRADTVVAGGDRTACTSITKGDEIWPRDVFGFVDKVAKLAHLVPASASNASMYADVARCVFAVGDGELDGDILQKLIHGSKMRVDSEEDNQNADDPDDSRNASTRIKNTGMKHLITNRIRLFLQKEYFEQRPCILIVPVLTLQAAREWKGDGYPAIFLAGAFPRDCEQTGEAGTHASDVYRLTPGSRRRIKTATPSQANTARRLLEATVLGLAYSFIHREGELMTGAENDKTRKTLDVLRRNPLAMNEEGVIVPKSLDLRNSNVALIEFSSHHERNDKIHLAPDPLLLVIKSAAIWSWRNGQQMLAVGEPPEEENELDILEEEFFLACRQDSYRPHSWAELAKGLGQPNGWPGDKGCC
jgi:hypothetical protein